MAGYYAYQIDRDGHIVGRIDIEARDDVDAVEQANALKTGNTIEVWFLDRRVTILTRH